MSLNSSRLFILTGGKGGSGRTPIALILAALLFRRGRNVILLDLNFANPDAFFIGLKIVSKRNYFYGLKPLLEGKPLRKVNDEEFPWPIRIYEVLSEEDGKHFLKIIAREVEYLYAPVTPHELFKTIHLVARKFRDVDIIVDSNLNLPSLVPISEREYEDIKDSLRNFSDKKVFYLINPATLTRRITVKGEEISEIKFLKEAIDKYREKRVDLFGERGENIVYILTPNLYKEVSESTIEKIYKAFLSIFSARTPAGVSRIILGGKENKYLTSIIKALIRIHQLNSEGTITIDTLMSITEKYVSELKEAERKSVDFGVGLRSMGVIYFFFKAFLREISETWQQRYPNALIPKNLVIVPYMVEKMINYVAALLASEKITLDTILERAKEVSSIFEVWISQSWKENQNTSNNININ